MESSKRAISEGAVQRKPLALVLIHRLIDSMGESRRYKNRYNCEVVKVPVPSSDRYELPKNKETGEELPFELVDTTLTERIKPVLGDNIPDLILCEANYSHPASPIANLDLIQRLMETYPNATFVMRSSKQKALDHVKRVHSTNLNIAYLNTHNPSASRCVDEGYLIMRLKNQLNGRRNSEPDSLPSHKASFFPIRKIRSDSGVYTESRFSFAKLEALSDRDESDADNTDKLFQAHPTDLHHSF